MKQVRSVAQGLQPEDLEAVGTVCAVALRPFADADWSVRAGSLEWDVSRTVSHMIGACAKYTLYLAAAGETFIGLTCSRFDGATQMEMVDSIVPAAQGLANLVRWAPSTAIGFHGSGPKTPTGYITMACEELLIHTYDALLGLKWSSGRLRRSQPRLWRGPTPGPTLGPMLGAR